MRTFAPIRFAALALLISCGMASAGKITSSTPQPAYPPKDWVFIADFRNFPYEIQCREETGKGTVTKSGSGSNVSYKVTNFDEAETLICTVPRDRSFKLNVKYLLGYGNTERRMGAEYFAGEIRKINLKVQYQGRGTTYPSYKAHVKLFTVFGKERVIYSAQDMFAAFFPERANQPVRRWKP
ncbi:hypothetical protein Q8W37_10670 [Shimia thalassica]|uniref:hypothetical protein n=1 Tax=Shimia thalassica TaxID=1715693 RepID=UPI00273334A0|nr:hypothetical protein [Shimia thalassica]MDP2580396.1 hypothetical protein [Shimia thalassica]